MFPPLSRGTSNVQILLFRFLSRHSCLSKVTTAAAVLSSSSSPSSSWSSPSSSPLLSLLGRAYVRVWRVTRRARARADQRILAHRDPETQPCGRLTDWRLRLTLCRGADYPRLNAPTPLDNAPSPLWRSFHPHSPTITHPSNPRGARARAWFPSRDSFWITYPTPFPNERQLTTAYLRQLTTTVLRLVSFLFFFFEYWDATHVVVADCWLKVS